VFRTAWFACAERPLISTKWWKCPLPLLYATRHSCLVEYGRNWSSLAPVQRQRKQQSPRFWVASCVWLLLGAVLHLLTESLGRKSEMVMFRAHFVFASEKGPFSLSSCDEPGDATQNFLPDADNEFLLHIFARQLPSQRCRQFLDLGVGCGVSLRRITFELHLKYDISAHGVATPSTSLFGMADEIH
jgi:hypothetical protein